MKKYEPTLEEIKFALGNARKILEQIFPHVADHDVAKFRELMRKRLDDYYKKNPPDEIVLPSKDKVKECKSGLIGYNRFHVKEGHAGGQQPSSTFGIKFKDKYGKMVKDRSLYDKEKYFFRTHGYCSWEHV